MVESVNEQNAVKVDERSKDKVEEFYTAAVQTRAQKQDEISATSQSPYKDKDVEALNVTSEKSRQIQNGDVHEIKHCKKAREEPVKTQRNHKKYLDKKARLRVLVNGDKVLVLLPTASNKLLFQWKGPAVITERRGLVNYRVRFESGEEKTFHINMLKKYNQREDSDEAPANMPVVNSGQFTNNDNDKQ